MTTPQVYPVTPARRRSRTEIRRSKALPTPSSDFDQLILFFAAAVSLWIIVNLNDNIVLPLDLMNLHMQH